MGSDWAVQRCGLEGLASTMAGFDSPREASRSKARPAAVVNTSTTWTGPDSKVAGPPSTGAASPFGGASPGDAREAGEAFDLARVLADVAEFIDQLFSDGARTSPTSGGCARPPSGGPPPLGWQERASTTGEWTSAQVQAHGQATAEAHLRAQASSEAFVDAQGVGVRGGAEVSAGVSAEARGEVVTDLGSLKGRARVSAEVYARAHGEARVNTDGSVTAAGRAEVGALVKAEAAADAELLGGLVEGHAQGVAQSGAGAQATGRARLGFSPPQAAVEADAGAFAGARAGFEAKGGVAGASYGFKAEALAGAGAQVNVKAGLDDGQFTLKGSISLAVGVGVTIGLDLAVDTRDVGRLVSGVVGAAGQLLGAVFGAMGQDLGDDVGRLFDGGSACGRHAGQVLDRAAPPPRAPATSPPAEAPEPDAAAEDGEALEDATTEHRSLS